MAGYRFARGLAFGAACAFALGCIAESGPDEATFDTAEQALLSGPAWPQWGQNERHAGSLGVVGQPFLKTYLNYVYDPLVPDETGYNEGDLLAHYMTPLTESDAVYMEQKQGTYSPNTYSTQQWGIVKFQWVKGQLVKKWSMWSDWKAVGSQWDFWEPVFHATLANGYLYVPGAKGTMLKVRKSDGTIVSTIKPIGNNDGNTFTVSPPTADANGNLYFTVLKLTGESMSVTVSADESFTAPRSAKNWHAPRTSNFYGKDAVDSWLVKVAPNDTTKIASFSKLIPGAPKANDDCLTTFSETTLPWPPSPDAVPDTYKCGTQRAAVNAAPAVAADGTIYLISRAHFVSRYGYLVAVKPDLTPKWAATLRDRFNDGCGVALADGGQLPPNGAPGGCRVGANVGVDPATNRPGGGRVLDDASSSPTIAPDGSIYYGAYSRYNYFQGHLMHFSATGGYLNAYGFGWDTTPAIWVHSGTYSVITKDNHYSEGGSYCNDPSICPEDRNEVFPENPEAYRVTQLSPDLQVEWTFVANNPNTCHRDAAGAVTCVNDHPHSFEWCVNAPAVDANGTVFANSEDGWLYALAQGGTVKDAIFQQNTIGAAYTPASLGTDGKIYSQNSGHLFVIGK